jgi:hypothetical protein
MRVSRGDFDHKVSFMSITKITLDFLKQILSY